MDHWAHEHAANPNLHEPDVTEEFESELAQMEADLAAVLPESDWEPLVDDKFPSRGSR